MKNLSISVWSWMLTFLFLITISCKNTVEIQQPLAKQDETLIKNNGNFLEFKTLDAYNSKLKELRTKSINEINDWEESLNFVSMRRLYEIAIVEESKFFKNTKVNTRSIHSNFVLENKKYFAFENDERFFWINSPSGDNALNSLINKEGILKIGNYLMQYTKDYNKVMRIEKNFTSTDVDKIKLATKTSESDKLYVSPNKEAPVRSVKDPRARYAFHESCERNSYDNSKMELWTSYYNNPNYNYNAETDQLTIDGWYTIGELKLRVFFWGPVTPTYLNTWRVEGTYDLNCEPGYSYLGCQHKTRYYNANGTYSSGGTATLEVVQGLYNKPSQFDYLEYTLHITNCNLRLYAFSGISTVPDCSISFVI